MSRFFITRSEPGASLLAQQLQTQGANILVHPLLECIPISLPSTLKVEDFSGLLITSQHALPAAQNFSALTLAIVGESAASKARELGFTILHSAPHVRALCDAIRDNHLFPQSSKLLYLSGEEVRYNVAELLPKYSIHQHYAYNTRIHSLSPTIVDSLSNDNDMDTIIILQSVRTAIQLVAQFQQHALSPDRYTLLCQSELIAETVSHLHWHRIHVCTEPSEQAIIAASQQFIS